ncbi:hypothetical protein HJFPF1_08136 [Paramyrothecium foliicola]|nr:hypothetical protein HJFPF1_08136 [Paramyrothecium foliicola]
MNDPENVSNHETSETEPDRDTFPHHGATYYNRHQLTRKLIFACVEKDEWCDFRNTVTGRYLTVNEQGSFLANTSTHGRQGLLCCEAAGSDWVQDPGVAQLEAAPSCDEG